ncbi:multidrug efflux protein [Opitutaceae bacterium EW11]|nr:multidrug efflux protein [Opitutaceae bacterium EW11]
MNITEVFIRRPVLATVVNVFILLAGWQALKALNVRQYPKTNNAVVTVTTSYPGASADLVRGFITTPLEREIASADGIDYVDSTSAANVSIIKAKLRLNYDPNDALTQITSKVNKVRSELPSGSEDPVFDVAVGESTAAMYISFNSDVLQANQITDYLVRVVQPKIVTAEGVQKADVLGARTFAMRIWLDPERLAAFNLSPAQVRDAIGRQSFLSAIGKTKGALITVNLTADTDLRTPEEFRNMIIRENDGEQVRLRDVADVALGAEDYDIAVKFSGRPAIFMAVYPLPTANSLDVVKNVRALFPEIQSQLPKGINMVVPYDSTEFINDSINEVIHTLLEATIIVVLVVYLFLGTFRSIIIPIVAIPLSIVGVCVLMLALGFSINLLTLLAMVLAIGLVVDDAIVVVENIHRHIEEGLAPFQAAIKGAHELVGPVIAMTITLAAVYAPIGFQSGLTGALFREFAFTLAGAVVVSGFVALTLSPMLSSKLLRHTANPKGFAALLDRAFNKLQSTYERLLDHALNYRFAVYGVAGVLVLAMVVFFKGTRSELAPPEDRGFIMGLMTSSPNASLEQASVYVDQIYDRISKMPESKDVFHVVGIDPMVGMPSSGSAFIGWALKPWSQRERAAPQMVTAFQGATSDVAGANVVAFQPPSLPGAGGGMSCQFVISSTESHERVVEVANELLSRALKSGLFMFGDTDLRFDQPQVDIKIDRLKAADLGISMQQVAADLGSMLGGGYVSRYSMDGRAYKVTPQVLRTFRLNPEQLKDYYISTGKGELVPLSTIATLEPTVQPRMLKRFQQLNAATLSLLPRPGVTLGQALDWLNNEAKEVFPQGYSKDYNGELRQFVQEGSSLMVTFILAIVVIYLVLCAQYESFRDPFIIMMSVPLSIAGAMVFLFFGFATLNIFTQVGLITLVGLITKHGILIVEFANKLQEEKGYGIRQAVEHAAGVRLRPILMTTCAMVLGALPLVTASGAGAESRFSIGLVIVAGMSIGTFFTLFVVPAFYVLLAKDRRPASPPVHAAAHAKAAPVATLVN